MTFVGGKGISHEDGVDACINDVTLAAMMAMMMMRMAATSRIYDVTLAAMMATRMMRMAATSRIYDVTLAAMMAMMMMRMPSAQASMTSHWRP
jgi:hypothetical protein